MIFSGQSVPLLITGNVLKHFPTIAASAMHENGDGTLKTGKMPIKSRRNGRQSSTDPPTRRSQMRWAPPFYRKLA